MTDTTFKANSKSDDYLIRHFFEEFVSVCQDYYFPNLLAKIQLERKVSPVKNAHLDQESGNFVGDDVTKSQGRAIY